MSEYLSDAQHFFKRASALLSIDEHGREEVYDMVVLFAFGVERAFKAILHQINPVFVFEDMKLENLAFILYADKLTPYGKGLMAKKEKEEETNRKLKLFGDAMKLFHNSRPSAMKAQARDTNPSYRCGSRSYRTATRR